MKLSKNAITILRKRYLLRNKNREIIETPLQMFRRVAKTMAEAKPQPQQLSMFEI